MSLLQKFGEPMSRDWPTGFLTLHGAAHRITLNVDLKSWTQCTPHVKISYMDFNKRIIGNDHTCWSLSHHFSPIVACNMSNNCSFTCFACNDDKMINKEYAPIASSFYGDFSFYNVEHPQPFILHLDHSHTSYFIFYFDVFGDVQMKLHFLLDDLFLYYKQNIFLWTFVSYGFRTPLSTAIEHELTKRAIDSIIKMCL